MALVVLIAAEALMLAGIRPFTTWFYSLAWWSYIFGVDHLVYRRTGNSLWMNRRREFYLLIPVSVFIWMIFEGYNFYLQNWRYVGIIREAPYRWFGYFLAYGTVLPALFETYELLDSLGMYRNHRSRPIPRTTAWHPWFTLVGVLFLYAPFFWPQYAFPLVWGGFIFLLEPVAPRRGGRSLMREMENGSRRTFLLLLTAGLICGGLWEFWNFWAESKWEYHVPFVAFLKVFEMPLLGFGGFPPFAVECYVMTQALYLFRGGRGWNREDAGKPARTRPVHILLALLLFLAVFIMAGRIIDHVTIQSFI
jgi:hypothetical protein